MGETQVGKTSLIHRFITNEFSTSDIPTIGANYYAHSTVVDGERLKLQIWDTAGQEQYRAIGPVYYRTARAAIAVCDVTKPETIDKLSTWIEAYRANTDENFVVIVGNKCDLVADTHQISTEILERAELLGATSMMTSALTGEGVDELFTAVAMHCWEKRSDVVSERNLLDSASERTSSSC
jgi:small GTP-binding protein